MKHLENINENLIMHFEDLAKMKVFELILTLLDIEIGCTHFLTPGGIIN